MCSLEFWNSGQQSACLRARTKRLLVHGPIPAPQGWGSGAGTLRFRMLLPLVVTIVTDVS